MHNCEGMKGLSIPMIEVKSPRDDPNPKRTQHTAQERGDFIGSKKMEPFRPITVAVKTERFDGSNDCTVFPGTAVVFMNEGED